MTGNASPGLYEARRESPDRLQRLLSLVARDGRSKQGSILLDDVEYDFRVYNDGGVYHLVLSPGD